MTTKAKTTLAALALLAALGLGAGSAAQAGGYGYDEPEVFWSIAMSQPGIHIGVSNMPAAPMVVHERRHVYVQPQPIYVPPPRVVYLPPHPVYRVHPGYQGHGHWKDRHDRHERWEHRHERHGGYERHERHGGYDRHERHGRDGRIEHHAQGPARPVPHLGNGGGHPQRGIVPNLGR